MILKLKLKKLNLSNLYYPSQDFYPRAISSRIVLGVWWIFTILILATYTADLTAYLSVRVVDSTINSLDDLAKPGLLTPLVKKGSNAYALFELADSGSVYADVFKRMTDIPDIRETLRAVEVVRTTQKYAFLSDASQLRYYSTTQCEEFKLLPVQFNVAGFGWPMKRNSVFKSAINKQLAKLKESGYIRKLTKKWWQSSKICSEETARTSTLTIHETGGVFLILAGFVFLACLILLVESIIIKLKHQKISCNN